MTGKQLNELEAMLDKQHPGWKVARGGILMEPATGTEMVVCTTPIGNKTIIVDFDTMKIIAMQG